MMGCQSDRSLNPSLSFVFNLCLKTSDWYMWVASSVDYILQLMLVCLFGGRLYVQIHYAIQYPSDLEHEYDLCVVTFVLEDMGEVLS